MPFRHIVIVPICHVCHFVLFVQFDNRVRRTDFIDNGDQSLSTPSTRLVFNCSSAVSYSYCRRRAAVSLCRVLSGHARQVFAVGYRLRYTGTIVLSTGTRTLRIFFSQSSGSFVRAVYSSTVIIRAPPLIGLVVLFGPASMQN